MNAICMHALTISEKRGQEKKEEWVRVHGSVWREKSKGIGNANGGSPGNYLSVVESIN